MTLKNCPAKLICLLLLLLAPGMGAASPLAVVPQPVSVVEKPGSLRLDDRSVISIPAGDNGARLAAERVADWLQRSLDVHPAIKAGQDGVVRFVRVQGMKPEHYRLDVTPHHATITASDDAGLFYGGVTLWQLATRGQDAAIPAVRIIDGPRFAWRGLMLDSARHFQSVGFIKSLIDAMAANKLNTLHWHLTDDQGWRIEIKKYPRLTQVSAWRIPASVAGAPPLPRTGGYYTQDQIRDIVAYAADRNVTIVPEIEMPGHALSAIRAYPGLGVGPPMAPGAESDWGVFPTIYNIDDRSFGFLEDVLDEVMALFPSRYIHVGGDEAVKDHWRDSPEIQARMRALGIADEKALQSWFMQRIGRYLTAHDRRMIGWDEILEGGIGPDATVMSWRGIDGAITAARSGHDAVLAASPTLYLDHVQSDRAGEGPGRWVPITLEQVYAFDPAPAKLTADEQRHILGLQANLWTEHVRGDARAAYMAFPRASAVAELGWSAARDHDFVSFAARMVPQIERMKDLGIAASPSAYIPTITLTQGTDDNHAMAVLANQVHSTIRYTLDGTMPTQASPTYVEALQLALPVRLRAVGFHASVALPGALDQTISAASLLHRNDRELELCNSDIALALEDDAPANGPRASSLIGISQPCWIYRNAPLDGVTAIAIDVGQIPFNFQIGKDIEKIHFRAPATLAGEFEVRAGDCAGDRIAVLPLAEAAQNPQVTRLSVPIAPQSGAQDLCITYTANGPDPLWAVHAVQLIKP